MKNYVCKESVMARPITLGEYNIYRGWIIPENEDPSEIGYLIKDNTGRERYEPKEVFDAKSELV